MSPSSTSMSLIMNSPHGEAHGCAAGAAAAGLHEHHLAAPGGAEASDRLARRRGGRDACRNDRLGHHMPLEEAERLGAVADQQVLRLAVMVEHHPVVLPAHAGDLVTTERRPCRIRVVAVRPDTAGLDLAA